MKNKTIIIIIFSIVVALAVFLFLGKNQEEAIPELIVSNKNITIKKGDKYTINAYIRDNPNAILLWESSNNNVVNITDGVADGLNYGNAIITITYVYGDNKILTDNCIIKVTSGDNSIQLSSLSFQEGDLLIGLNKPYDINNILNIIPKDSYIESKYYESSNKGILDVDNDGVIRCLSTGNADVKVRLNSTLESSIRVYCVDKSINPELIINPISIKMSDDKIKVGETKGLNYTISPNNANTTYLSFSSLDSSIVSIDSEGNIKGLKAGTTNVIIKTINGLTEYCNITVENNSVLATAINVSKDKIELKVGEKYVLTPTVTPANAENNFLSFSSSDNNVAMLSMNDTQNSITINAVSSGNAIITIKTNNGISKQVNVTVKSNQSSNTSSSNNTSISTSEYPLATATIISTGNVNSSLMSSATDSNFEECRKVSPNLTLKINGTTVGQDGSVTIPAGKSFKVEVYLPTKCGRILTLTRTSPDGSSSWGEYFKQNDNPYVDRNNSSTYLSGVTKYTWTIAAKKVGSCTLSQTAQFDVESPSGRKANIKSMIRLKVKAT